MAHFLGGCYLLVRAKFSMTSLKRFCYAIGFGLQFKFTIAAHEAGRRRGRKVQALKVCDKALKFTIAAHEAGRRRGRKVQAFSLSFVHCNCHAWCRFVCVHFLQFPFPFTPCVHLKLGGRSVTGFFRRGREVRTHGDLGVSCFLVFSAVVGGSVPGLAGRVGGRGERQGLG